MTGGDRWTTSQLSTVNPGRSAGLWKAGDNGGRATPPLTCGNVGFSTIHSPCYYS